MAQHDVSIEIAKPLEEVFAFFIRPANLAKLAPADMNLELVEGPEVLVLGARVTWKARRWGIAQKIVQEVTNFETDRLVVEEQKQGPFASWRVSRKFTAISAGTIVHEEILFEPPGGMLGMLVTAQSIKTDLGKLFAHRTTRLRELLG